MCSSARGSTRRNRAASSCAGSCVKPAKITCSSFRACSAIAAAIPGCAWPCRFTHHEEMRVQQLAAVGGIQINARGALDQHGLRIERLLRERVPDRKIIR